MQLSTLKDIVQSGEITGPGRVPNLVQVCRIRYIQSHNESDRPKLFQISNCQITEKYHFVFVVTSFDQNIILRTLNYSIEYKTMHYSIYKVLLRKIINQLCQLALKTHKNYVLHNMFNKYLRKN